MMNVPLQDTCFLNIGSGMGGVHCKPARFKWLSVATGAPARFYDDWAVTDAPNHPRPRVAWLIHSPEYARENYEFVLAHEAEFDYVLTYVKSYVERNPAKWLWYPCGGSQVSEADWHDYPKTNLVSMLASNKNAVTGHRLRHEILGKFGASMDAYGSIVDGRMASKLDAIAPYCFTVTVAGDASDWCLPDHLLDCFALGTIPIFWGCPQVGKFFDLDGIIPFSDLNDLLVILERLSFMDFVARLPAVHRNREMARQYRVPEDWIFSHYPFLFEGLE